ncbi:hypothetical protein VNO78_23506 [Psophocarpus tetragonolobus]|uniref:Uncharacterized protein n=1 Tax=Psophocarpus tetragonolobus TaxID=3891 RepID=A0AAN9S3T3_PSOTE
MVIVGLSLWLYQSLTRLETRLFSWIAPPLGAVAVNVDGSVTGGQASYGGVCCDSIFVFDFYDYLGETLVLYVELMALLHGFKFCRSKEDNEVVDFLTKQRVTNGESLVLLDEVLTTLLIMMITDALGMVFQRYF